MKILLGILIAIIIGGLVYYFGWLKPNHDNTEIELIEANKDIEEGLAKFDSIQVITELLTKDMDSLIKKAESYSIAEKEALKRADINYKKYVNLKNGIPETLQECIDQSTEEKGHLVNVIFNKELAYKKCDSARTTFKAALKKCQEIPNANTGIDIVVDEINQAWERKYDAGIKIEKQKGNKKLGIGAVLGIIIGALLL